MNSDGRTNKPPATIPPPPRYNTDIMPTNPLTKFGPFNRKQIAGFAFIYLAGLGWLTDVIVLFTQIPHKGLIFSIALGTAELSFLIGVGLLGKAYYAQIKHYLINRLRQK